MKLKGQQQQRQQHDSCVIRNKKLYKSAGCIDKEVTTKKKERTLKIKIETKKERFSLKIMVEIIKNLHRQRNSAILLFNFQSFFIGCCRLCINVANFDA